MAVIHLQSKTDHDGNVHIAVGVPDAIVDLVVVVNDALPRHPESDDEWVRAVLSLQGSINDPTFHRPSQGDYPTREPLT